MEEKKGGMSPAVMGGIAVAVLAVAFVAYKFLAPSTPTTTGGPGTNISGTPNTSGTPSGPSAEEVKQTELKNEAQKLADSEQFDAAINKVDDALKINGPLNADLQKYRASLQKAKTNIATIKLEKGLWDEAQKAYTANDFNTALSKAKQVAKLKGGLHLTDAEKYLREIPVRQREESDFAEAKRLTNKGDSLSLQAAIPLLENVVKGTAHKAEAEPMLARAKETVKTLSVDDQVKGYLASGKQSVDRGDFTAARQAVTQIKGLGKDAGTLEGQIGTGEKKKLDELVRSFNSAKSAKDTGTLNSLVADFKRLGEGGSSVAGQANDYATSQINNAISEIKSAAASAEVAENERAEKASFDKAVNDFNAAVKGKNKDALSGPVTSAFRNLSASAKYGSQANDYINSKIQSALTSLAWSCPPLPPSTGGQLAGEFKPGMVVPISLLEASLTWGECPQPPAWKTTVMLSVDLDETGAVINVKPRSGTADPAIIDTIKKWKTTAGPKYKGQGVKTSIPMDLKAPK